MEEDMFEFKIHKELLNCPVCREIMIDPKLLSCSHRVCGNCLSCMSKSECPICRKPFYETHSDLLVKEITANIKLKRECGISLNSIEFESHKDNCLPCIKSEYEGLRCMLNTLKTQNGHPSPQIRNTYPATSGSHIGSYPIIHDNNNSNTTRMTGIDHLMDMFRIPGANYTSY